MIEFTLTLFDVCAIAFVTVFFGRICDAYRNYVINMRLQRALKQLKDNKRKNGK